MSHESHEHHHEALHLSFKIAKLVLKSAMLAVAICGVKELHRVHKAIEQNGKKH